MKASRFAAVSVMALTLSACGTTFDLNELKDTKPTGSPFTQALSREYLAFAESEAQQYDWADQQVFARKGLAAARGESIAPVVIAEWRVAAAVVPELTSARATMMELFAQTATAKVPALSATAQVKFDCWVEQLEEGWQTDHIAACRKDFYTAIEAIKAAMKPPAPTAAKFQVFFDFNSTKITPAAAAIISEAAQRAKGKAPVQLLITGHADTVGSPAYNQRLSVQRANAVRAVLVHQGLGVDRIEIVGKGESDLLVPTKDGTPEAQNRRAVINIR
ncbi:MAG: OmpA family protein [Alphaproteobacteria bacterium]|nr:OmpA family protein [Alphaproteobacteria bacterium]